MVKNSLEEAGAGRSILVDKEGRIIAGNTTMEGWREVNPDAPIVLVETTGDELVVVQRTDLDLEDDSTPARKLSYLDNRSSEVGMAWQVDRIMSDIEKGLDFTGIFNAKEIDSLVKESQKSVEKNTSEEARAVVFRESVQLLPQMRYVVVLCTDEGDFEHLAAAFQLEEVRRGGYALDSQFNQVSLERVIPYSRIKHLTEPASDGETGNSDEDAACS